MKFITINNRVIYYKQNENTNTGANPPIFNVASFN